MNRSDYFTCALRVEENRNKKMFCIDKVFRKDGECFIDGKVGDISLKVGDTFTRYKNLSVSKIGKFYKEQEMILDFTISVKIEKIFISFTSTVREMPSHRLARLQVSGQDIEELVEGMVLLIEQKTIT